MSPKRRESPERTKTKAKTTRPDRLIELAEAIKEAVEGGRCVDWSAVDGGRLAKGRDAPTRAVVDWCIEEARRRFARLAQAYADCHLNCDLTEDEDLRLSDAIFVFQVKREPVLPFFPDAETRAFDKGLKDLAWRFKYRARQEAAKMQADEPTAFLPGWKRNKLELKRLPNGNMPAVFGFGSETYTVPSGKAWDVVCRLIKEDAFDGHGHIMPAPGGYFRRQHRTFFSKRMTYSKSGWYIKTR